jgi:hypothetical protein
LILVVVEFIVASQLLSVKLYNMLSYLQ